jgi:hypothetical protein
MIEGGHILSLSMLSSYPRVLHSWSLDTSLQVQFQRLVRMNGKLCSFCPNVDTVHFQFVSFFQVIVGRQTVP